MIIDPFRVPKSLVSSIGAALAPSTRPQQSLKIGDSHQHQTQRITAPAKLSPSELAIAACKAAQVAATDALIARLVPQLRQFGQRHPLASPPRLARLVAEAEIRGQPIGETALAAALRLDGFGLEAQQSATGDAGQKPGGDQPGANQAGLAVPLSIETAKPNADQGENWLYDLLGSKKGGRIAWHWFTIGPTQWSSGGSLRIADDPRLSAINLDIATEEGNWQFHWSEPRRQTLYFLPPSGKAAAKVPKLALQSFLSQIGPLGFKKMTEIQPEDWYDGFTFQSLGHIIKRVDLVG